MQETGLGRDWQIFWATTHGFRAHYESGLLFAPPWILPLLWLLTLLPVEIGWSLAAFATAGVLVLSVPKQDGPARLVTGSLLLVTSYPAMRQMLEGNIEAVVIGGMLILLWAYSRRSAVAMALGLLLVLVKIQLSWPLLLLLAVHLYREWPRRKLITAGSLVTILAVPFLLWKGREWLDAIIQISRVERTNASLLGEFARLGVPQALSLAVWGVVFLFGIWMASRFSPSITRLEVGWLAGMGLLLSPYASSLSTLTPLALGVTSLYQKQPKIGLLLFALSNIPYLSAFFPQVRSKWEATFALGATLITVTVLSWFLIERFAEAPDK